VKFPAAAINNMFEAAESAMADCIPALKGSPPQELEVSRAPIWMA